MRSMMLAAVTAVLAGAAWPALAQPRNDPGSLPNRSDYTLEVLDLLRHELVWRERQAAPGEGHLLYFADLSLVSPDSHRDISIAGTGQSGVITLVAFCDVDCRDIILTVLDEAGGQVAVSQSDGRSTEVTFQRSPARSYYARITVPGCRAAYCFYSLGALSEH
jgi:hypothetical protein